MTNSLNKMAGKNSAERNGTPGRPRSTSKLRSLKATMVTTNPYIATIATPPRIKSISISNYNTHINNVEVKLRLSPIPSNNRTSPGLTAGHFAGGKWTEPPSPASLPKPPQHWTQLLASASKCSAFAGGKPQQTDIASQLKVLLNVQA